MVAQKRFVQTPPAVPSHHVHAFAAARDLAQRVAAGVVHRRGRGHRAGVEGLHLIGAKAVFLQPQRQIHHVFVAGARVGCDEVRNQKLLLARFKRELVKHLLELVIVANAWLHHLGQRALLSVLRRNFEVAAHMVLHQLFHVLWRLDRKVVAQTRADQNLLDPFQRPATAVNLNQGVVVGRQVLANTGVHATGFSARRFNLGAAATQAVHVRSGAPQIGDGAGKAFDLVPNVFDFLDDRLLRAALDDAPLVLGD